MDQIRMPGGGRERKEGAATLRDARLLFAHEGKAGALFLLRCIYSPEGVRQRHCLSRRARGRGVCSRAGQRSGGDR